MSTEFQANQEITDNQAHLAALLADLSFLLEDSRTLGEMRQMETEVSDVIPSSDYLRFRRYKQACLDELGQLNCTSGSNGAMHSAIERGFILRYWLAQHPASHATSDKY